MTYFRRNEPQMDADSRRWKRKNPGFMQGGIFGYGWVQKMAFSLIDSSPLTFICVHRCGSIVPSVGTLGPESVFQLAQRVKIIYSLS
jgi:hypothetical protein